MYPFLRASRVLGRAISGRRKPALRTSVLQMRIWPNDLDTNAHVNNGRYLTLMDLGRFDLMTECGLVRTVLKNKWFPVAGGVMVRFERPLHIFEKIQLKSAIIGWDEKWLYFSHDIYTGEKRAARAFARGLFRTRGRSIPTHELLDAMDYQGKTVDPPASVLTWLTADRLMSDETINDGL
jgi:acyl-CoA thioesterase FadM